MAVQQKKGTYTGARKVDRENVRDRSNEENPRLHGSHAKRVPRRKNAVRINAMSFAAMVKAISEECYTFADLSELSGLGLQTTRLYVKALHKAKAIRVVDWTEDKRGVRSIRVWGLGDEPDAKKPQPLPQKEHSRKYRAKLKHIKLVQQMTGQYK